jgi:hypothetical protein
MNVIYNMQWYAGSPEAATTSASDNINDGVVVLDEPPTTAAFF